jgi:hypothetical protein
MKYEFNSPIYKPAIDYGGIHLEIIDGTNCSSVEQEVYVEIPPSPLYVVR